jgi:hypothetical protein
MPASFDQFALNWLSVKDTPSVALHAPKAMPYRRFRSAQSTAP